MKIDDTPVALERGLLFQTCCALSSFFLFERENERCLPSSAVSQHVASSLERSENDALPSSPTKTMPCLQSRASPSEFTTPALPAPPFSSPARLLSERGSARKARTSIEKQVLSRRDAAHPRAAGKAVAAVHEDKRTALFEQT